MPTCARVTHDSLGMIELHSTSQSALRKQAKLRDNELVELQVAMSVSLERECDNNPFIERTSLGTRCILLNNDTTRKLPEEQTCR